MKKFFEKHNTLCHSRENGNLVQWLRFPIRSGMTWGIILLFLVSIFNLRFPSVSAEEEQPKAKAVETCLKEYSDFQPPEKKNDPYRPFGDSSELTLDTPLAFRVAFEEARNQYHSFTQCIFDEAAKEILAADTGTDGFWSANTPNIPHLSEPDVACLDPETLTMIANSTGSMALLPPLLKAYNAYTTYLKSIHAAFDQMLHFDRPLDESIKVSLRKMEHLVLNETQEALTALHTSLAKLMELRQVFVMHVHFQCMLHNLEDYRKLLGELRNVIELLPGRIIDASMSK